MKRVLGITVVASLAVSALTTLAFAQQPAAETRVMIQQARIFQGPEGPPPMPPPGNNFVFVASESFDGKVVKGAPYSAEAVTESVQTLSDGNRIVNKFTSQVYRDSEGRTRREQTLKALNGVGNSDGSLQTIFIHDPVAGVTYSLDTRSHVAHKSMPFKFHLTKRTGGPGETQTFEFKTGNGSGVATSIITTDPAANAAPQAGTRVRPPAEEDHFSFRTEGTSGFVFRTGPNTNTKEVKEQLGKQMIEGVEAEGTRTTVTIPAGEIGNDRPIEIVSERWYSPELQLVVMTRHSDPRSGETTYKLTNIDRSVQSKSLFEVPAGFTVKEMQFGPPNVAPLPRKKMANPE
jgi:hypothetical protein